MTRLTTLSDLPEETLQTICNFAHPDDLHSLSQTSHFWRNLCRNYVWPRRVAECIGVRSILYESCPHPTRSTQQLPVLRNVDIDMPDSQTWLRVFRAFQTHHCTRTLYICVQLGNTDSVTSLALQYAVTPQDIFRTNLLFSEHQLASRAQLYVPLLTEDSVLHFTGSPTAQQTPYLVRDKVLSKKYFLVVKFRPTPDRPLPESDSHARRETYVRQLVVKLIAKGLSVEEDEVRFYLDDNAFDVAKAYKQLLSDHAFSA